MMLDSDGYLKMIDFDTVCKLDGDTVTNEDCGTEEYKAPEMFRAGFAYGKIVDFWAVGILIYEMLYG